MNRYLRLIGFSMPLSGMYCRMRGCCRASSCTRVALSSMKYGTFTCWTSRLRMNYSGMEVSETGQDVGRLTFLEPLMSCCMKKTVHSFSEGR